MRWSYLAAVVAITVGTFSARARAAGDDLSLSRGTWSAQSYAAYAGANNEALPSVNAGLGYYIIDHLALNLEGAAYGVFQDGADAVAGELRLLMRHHLLVRERFTLFADVGEGFFEASERVPEGGTRFNFVFRSGLGATYEIDDGVYLLGGLRYWHLSNAQMEGSERNPSINGVEGYIGLLWTLK